MHDKNSKFPKLFSFAKLAILRSSVAAPTSRVSFSINLISEKSFPSLITAPFTPSSLNKVFDPAPTIIDSKLFFCHPKKSMSCFYLSLYKSIQHNHLS